MSRLKEFACSCSGLGLIILSGLALCICASTTWLVRLAYQKDTDPEAHEAFIINFLGIEGLYTDAVGPSFETTYWNGQRVTFWVPEEVWSSSVMAGNKHGCDPWLVIATAFSESTEYNNKAESTAGALGVWQFISSTWTSMWGSNPPPRTHVPSAADAACRYLKKTGSVSAFRDGEDEFVRAFAVTAPVWNRHSGQARFVYRLTNELVRRDDGTLQPPKLAGLATNKWWAPLAIDILDMLGLMPEFEYVGGDVVGIPGSPGSPLASANASTSLPIFVIPSDVEIGESALGWICQEGWAISQGPHGMAYGHSAFDVVCGGGALYSPIDGEVTQSYVDGYGNPVLVIENEESEVTLLHGYYTVDIGDEVDMGDHIGYEANFGNTWSGDQYCGTGSDCGHHTHLNYYDKEEETNQNPLDLIAEAEEQHQQKQQQHLQFLQKKFELQGLQMR